MKINYFRNNIILNNSIYSLLQQAVALIGNLIIFSLIGKHFGLLLFGQYSYATTIVSFLAIPLSLGINIPIFSAVARKKGKSVVFLVNGLVLRYASMLVVLPALSLVIAHLIKIEYLLLVLLVAWYVGLNSVLGLYQGSFTNLNKNLYNLILSTIFKLVQIAAIFFLLNDFTLLFVVFNFVILINILFAHFLLDKFIPIKSNIILKQINIKFIKKLVAISFPLIIGAFSEFINLKIDQLFLGMLTNEQTLGIYSAATSIYLALTMVPIALIQVFFPNFIDRFKENTKSAYNLFFRFIQLFIMYALTLIIILFFTSESLIYFLFGSEFLTATPVITILSFSIPFVIINRLNNSLLAALGLYKLTAKILILGSLVNIFLNLLLIPNYGIFGAIYSTIATELLVFVFGFIIIYKNRIKSKL